MDVNNNVRPRRRVIRRRPPPVEGYYYYLSLLKALVQFLSYVICMIIVAGIEIRIAEMLYSNPWMNRSQAHPPEQFFVNRMDEFLVHMDFLKLHAIQDFTFDNSTTHEEDERSSLEELYDDAFVEEGTLLSILGEDQEVVIRSLIEFRADNLTGIRAIDENNDDRMAILNM